MPHAQWKRWRSGDCGTGILCDANRKPYSLPSPCSVCDQHPHAGVVLLIRPVVVASSRGEGGVGIGLDEVHLAGRGQAEVEAAVVAQLQYGPEAFDAAL